MRTATSVGVLTVSLRRRRAYGGCGRGAVAAAGGRAAGSGDRRRAGQRGAGQGRRGRRRPADHGRAGGRGAAAGWRAGVKCSIALFLMLGQMLSTSLVQQHAMLCSVTKVAMASLRLPLASVC